MKVQTYLYHKKLPLSYRIQPRPTPNLFPREVVPRNQKLTLSHDIKSIASAPQGMGWGLFSLLGNNH